MKYYSDGFTLVSNPSKTGGGYSIVSEDNGLLETKTIYKKGFTNNEGELLGVYNCLKLAEMYSEISVDSKCIIAWLRKKKAKARPDLNSIISECVELMNKKFVDVYWEGRDDNLAGQYNESVGL